MSAPVQLDSRTLSATLKCSGGELARRYEALWQALWQQSHVPAPILELCRLRLAQLHGAARELSAEAIAGGHAGPEPAKLASVLSRAWSREPHLEAAERAALEFAEVYAQDPQAITDELAVAVKTHFGEAGLVALIEALGVIDGRIRLAMMLETLLPAGDIHE